jgi:hypothetical protein
VSNPATLPIPGLGDRTAGQPSFTVSDLCMRWRVGADKIHCFIRRGELVAVNVATNLSARPQWRIAPEAVELFERRRSSTPPVKPPRRRRQSQEVDYYPGP